MFIVQKNSYINNKMQEEITMELNEAILCALEGEAVLFAGSGFSFGAKNVLSKDMPNGLELRDLLAEKLGYKNVQYSLGKVADYFESVFSTSELIEFIKEQCTNISHEKYHEEIMSVKWKGIYTTNYDRVIEDAALKSVEKRIITPITYSDDIEAQEKNNICVHINGLIDRLNSDTIRKEFKLTDSSYNCESLVGNDWYEFMVNDFSSAKCIFVVGFSMEFDVDILRLFSSPLIKSKVIFISSPKTDEFSTNTFNKYGVCYPIGIKELGSKIISEKVNYVPKISMSYKCFSYQYRAPLLTTDPTYEEVSRVYTFGEIPEKMFAKNALGEYKYLINRKAVDIALQNYTTKKILLAISDFGNGKTVFCSLFKNELRNSDIEIFTFVHRYSSLDSEISDICSKKKKTIVIIDNYHGHFDILRKFYLYGCKNITFLLTERYSINNLSYKRLCYELNLDEEDIKPLYLNDLQQIEVEDLSEILLSQSLAYTKDQSDLINIIENDCKRKFSSFLLYYFNSSKIKKELYKLYQTLESVSNNKLKETAIFLLIQSVSNLDLDFTELLDLLSADYVNFMKNESEFLSEIFDFSSGFTRVKSSIIAQELLKNTININDIIDVLVKVFREADKRHGQTYEELKKGLVSHSQFTRFLKDNGNCNIAFKEIERFYDEIRNTKFAKKNPFFWEQFASAYLDMKNYTMSKNCLDIALSMVKTMPSWFVPFQIKTIYGRYHIENALNDLLTKSIDPDRAIQAIIDATKCILEYYDYPSNNVYYIFKVASKYSIIYTIIKDNLNNRQNFVYIEQSIKVIQKMKNYLDNNKDSLYFTKVQQWKNELQSSIDEAKAEML